MGEKGEGKKYRRRTGEIKRKGKGEAACLHASNLLMVEEKQTISHYLSLAAAVWHCILLVPEQLTVQLCF